MPLVEHAVIAVAGLGSRLGFGKPKCLVEVAGRRILEWQLELLKEVPDVRLVVGYMEHDVIDIAFKVRRDLTLVRNPAYRTTTTQQSYWLGARYLEEPCLYLDGDIIFGRKSFHAFLASAASHAPLIGITPAKTQQAVFAAAEMGPHAPFLSVTGFSRTQPTEWEWANIACLPPGLLQENGKDVFSRLALHAPLRAQPVECCEVDTESDLAQAVAFASRISADFSSTTVKDR
ncbi:MAG TPA: NTP transferase domain-containing protein [Opitutales bacterium]|nr:NTP transferase domain-containing protein [Opitutales bacterium]